MKFSLRRRGQVQGVFFVAGGCPAVWLLSFTPFVPVFVSFLFFGFELLYTQFNMSRSFFFIKWFRLARFSYTTSSSMINRIVIAHVEIT